MDRCSLGHGYNLHNNLCNLGCWPRLVVCDNLALLALCNVWWLSSDVELLPRVGYICSAFCVYDDLVLFLHAFTPLITFGLICNSFRFACFVNSSLRFLIPNLHPICTCSCLFTPLTEGRSARDLTHHPYLTNKNQHFISLPDLPKLTQILTNPYKPSRPSKPRIITDLHRSSLTLTEPHTLSIIKNTIKKPQRSSQILKDPHRSPQIPKNL